MIVDKLSNAHLYYALSPSIEKGLKYLAQTDLTQVPDGKHTVDTGIVVGLNQYSTKEPEQGVFEAHRAYIDIQVLVRGRERIGYAFLPADGDDNAPSTGYDEKRDIQFFGSYKKNTETFLLEEGMFSIFFPTDLHMPGLHAGESIPVRKAVVKIPC